MKPMTSLFISLVALFFSCNNTNTPPDNDKLGDGMYAEITTNKGKILLQLEYQKTPLTVANFVTLAEGKNDMVTEKFKNKAFYDGIKFHRVIKDFMIQTGDPNGDGTGGPGYKFADEIVAGLKHDKGGILSMANAGKGTNGSQIFITYKATPHLDGLHTVFGHVVEGMDIVNLIEQGDVMQSVKILRVGKDAKKFDAPKVFKEYYQKAADAEKKKAEAFTKVTTEKAAYFADVKAGATKTNSGLLYKIVQKGKGVKPANGAQVYVHYAGYLENGSLFDSSYEEVARAFGKHDPARAAANAYTPLPFTAGTKSGMIPGFLEGLEQLSIGDKAVIFIPSHLGYGERGAGNVIPPNANLIFEIEMLDAMPVKK